MMMYSSDATRWQELVNGIMRQDWGWTDPAEAYVEQYWKAAKSMKDAYFIERSQTQQVRRETERRRAGAAGRGK